MSASKKSSHATRAIELVGLVLVAAILFATTRLLPPGSREGGGGPWLIATLGFLLLAGGLAGNVLAMVGLPHLTAYLAVGVIAGPHVLHLIDHESVAQLQPVNTLALALIALAGGAELKVEVVRRTLRSLSIAMGIQSVTVAVVVTVVFVVAAPHLIPFSRQLTTAGVWGVAMLWGVLAVSRSPAATLAVLSQTQARGPLASFSLAFVMSSDVVVVVLLAAVMGVARPLIDPSAELTFAAFADLAHEIVGSVAMGTTLGLVLALYLRFVGHQLLVVLLALGFGATETLHYVQFDPLLTFLAAGFVVQNLSKQGEKFLHAIEETGSVVYVVFFASAGAHLDIPVLKQLWPVALLLTGVRAAVTFGAARLSSRLAGDPPVIRRWAWAPLVSQAGLTLGLSAVIAREFPAFGEAFRALAIATVAINELVGPILFKLSLDRAAETRHSGVDPAELEPSH